MNDRWRWEYGPRAVALLIAGDWRVRSRRFGYVRGRTMTIVAFLEGRVFRPEDIQAMSTVLEDICKILNLADEAKSERELLARKIIALARQGERSAAILRDRMLREIAYGRGGWAAGSQPLHLPNELVWSPFSDGRLARKPRKQLGRRGAR